MDGNCYFIHFLEQITVLKIETIWHFIINVLGY